MDITIKSTAAWFFGIIFIIGGLGMIAESLIGGLITALLGIFLIPNVRQEISERYDVQFSTWMVVLITVIGIGIAGATLPDDTEADISPDNNTQQPSDTEDNEPTQTNTQDQQDSTESRTHSIGESFKVGELSYKVNDVRTQQIVGTNQYLQEEADGEFVLVEIDVTNEGQESTTISNSHLKLVDSQDRSYSVDTDAFAAVENSFTFEQLDPGLSKSGTLVYDTPPDQQERQLEVSPTSVFSTAQPHYVELEG